jgi:hypothetical protein
MATQLALILTIEENGFSVNSLGGATKLTPFIKSISSPATMSLSVILINIRNNNITIDAGNSILKRGIGR